MGHSVQGQPVSTNAHLPRDYLKQLQDAQKSGTWHLLDPQSYPHYPEIKRTPIQSDRKPLKDPRSECPCGGGLLRMDCDYHKDS